MARILRGAGLTGWRWPLALALSLVLGVAEVGQAQPESGGERRPQQGMLRYPDVSATHLVFVYANDLWIVPREGGLASPLASPPGAELFPRFSPSGEKVAFMGNYGGGPDLYSIEVGGGVPQRLTHHPSREWLCDWTPDGKELLYHTSGYAGAPGAEQLFTVSSHGGTPKRLPPLHAANGALSPDQKRLVFTPHTRDHSTWKRYMGGLATNLWLFELETGEARRITEWAGTDSQPMWHEGTIYYLSDRGKAHRLNIWAYDTGKDTHEQITAFADHDARWPSLGPGPTGKGEIVFQLGNELRLLDLETRKDRGIDVRVPGARPRLLPQTLEVSELVTWWSASPTGANAVIEARGELFLFPLRGEGVPQNLTRSSGAADRYPVWSPGGGYVAFVSDRSGEYELYLLELGGDRELIQLTEGSSTYYFAPVFSPSGDRLAYADKTGTIRIVDVVTKKVTEVDREPFAEEPHLSFSHDGSWLAYDKTGDSLLRAIWLYHVPSGKKSQATSGRFDDQRPAFDRTGDLLYFVSARDFSDPVYEDVGSTFVYTGTSQVLYVPLRDAGVDPLHPWIAHEPAEGDEEEEADPDEAGRDPLQIDVTGFEGRARSLPIDPGDFGGLAVDADGWVVYARTDEDSIHYFDPYADEPEELTILTGASSFEMLRGGAGLMAESEGELFYVAIEENYDASDRVPMEGLRATIDPRAEWREVFTDAWRRYRDFFYVRGMHGLDWEAVRKRYEPLLEDCASRDDVSYVIGEMIAELNVGHAYYSGGEDDEASYDPPGLLGADIGVDGGVFQIERIYEGAPWDTDARSPLRRAGARIEVGEYLLRVNGVLFDTSRAIGASLAGLAGETVTLTVGALPDPAAKETREVVVTLLEDDQPLRYRAWVEENRARVERLSGGRVGYIYVPDTDVHGQNELFRQFYGQRHLPALLIDERYNAGGQIPDRFIELLNRPRTNYWARRDGRDWPWPSDGHHGPKAMLVNGMSGSGGDMFPWLFRSAGLGEVIGTRTWGGLVGVTNVPPLIDGGYAAVPTFGFYEPDGTWGIEGYGVAPDVEVIADPAALARGEDPQIEVAVKRLLAELERNPPIPPPRPAEPDRRGMGVRPEDR